MRGNCYAAAEALWHITGGKNGPWMPQVMRVKDAKGKPETHWFLRHRRTGEVLDPSVMQFGYKTPNYELGRGCGFLTPFPSKRAQLLLKRMTWQTE